MEIARIGDTRDRLGENPLWDARSDRLFWLDGLEGVVHALDTATGERRDHRVPAPVGSMALAEDGAFILALADGFHHHDPATGATALLAPLPGANPALRLNDGKVDRQGRFLAGTMQLHWQEGEPVQGGMFRLDGARAVPLAGDFATFNGPCFSPDGATLYAADSTRRVIWAFDYDAATGTPANRRVFAEPGTAPDGATVDAEGHVWTALVRAGEVARLDPAGRLVRRIPMPVRHPTSVAFGGPGLETLYVTSISRSVRLADDSAGAGGLFAIRGLGVRGLEERRCALPG